jgi:hypothetical protein
MTDKAKNPHGAAKPAQGGGDQPAAESVGRQPDPAPTPEDKQKRIEGEDEPKGHPTSDRFHSEQAHRTTEDKD